MSDLRNELEREVRRHKLPDGTFDRIAGRRDRRRRNRRAGTVAFALIVAALGSFGLIRAFGNTESPRPVVTPNPNPSRRPSQPVPAGPIQFLDARHGWVVRSDGTILATSDGGGSWSTVYLGPPAGQAVQAVQFVDLQHGWAVTSAGLLGTSDGGVHWSMVSSQRLGTVQFVTANLGWGVNADTDTAAPRSLVKTTDGGRTWSRRGLSVDSVCHAGDPATGVLWAAGPSDAGVSLFRSTDSGRTFTDLPLPLPRDVSTEPWTATVRCGGNEAWVVIQGGGAAGHVAYAAFHTVGGASPAPVLQEGLTHPLGIRKDVYASPDPYPGPFTAFDGTHAYFLNWCPECGNTPTASITEVAGTDVARYPLAIPGTQTQPLGVSFVDPRLGWALIGVSSEGRNIGIRLQLQEIAVTSDGGRTWRPACPAPECFGIQPSP